MQCSLLLQTPWHTPVSSFSAQSQLISLVSNNDCDFSHLRKTLCDSVTIASCIDDYTLSLVASLLAKGHRYPAEPGYSIPNFLSLSLWVSILTHFCMCIYPYRYACRGQKFHLVFPSILSCSIRWGVVKGVGSHPEPGAHPLS